MQQAGRRALRACVIDALEHRAYLAASPSVAALPKADATAPARVMEYLDRGVVATRSSTTQAFVSWRSLALDPASMSFNVYRAANGGAAIKLNAAPLTGGTNYTDATANLAVPNAYFVRPVVNGVEQAASGRYTLRANADVAPMFSLPLRNITGTATDYQVEYTWVGDLDADGEYDFVVSRVPLVAGRPDVVEAYRRDGTFLWAYDAGPNSFDRYRIEPGSTTLSVGNWDGVTVYDLDGDGLAEVFIRTADGATFGDGQRLSHPPTSEAQFISVLDGRTGAERARVAVPDDFRIDGPMAASFGVGYLDGVHPSLIAKMKNRVGDEAFNQMFVAYDFDGQAITQRWKHLSAPVDSDNGHQIRIVDLDGDGKDEIADTAQVIDDDGTLLYNMRPRIVHGDRFFIGDLDPDRPGLEGYGVQQNNPTMLAEYYYDAATGEVLHEHFATGVMDNGRGIVGDIDPAHRGFEYWSFFGIYNSKTPAAGAAPVETKLADEPKRPWPNFNIWWDGDLLGESLNAKVIDQWNPAAQGTSRVTTLYHYGSPADRGGEAPTFYGDILGDWREEVIYERSDRTALNIYTTQIPSAHRLYTLAQNPAYRNGLTIKGYMQSHLPDYYLGDGMATPPTPGITLARNANAAPSVATKAAATPTVVAGTAAVLSVLGADDGGEPSLNYTWTAVGPAAVSFSANGTNAAKQATATFAKAGRYIFTVTIRDAAGRTALSNVAVMVNATLASVAVTPGSVSVGYDSNQQFAAAALDQFGNALAAQPAFQWTVAAGGGTVDANGLYTPPATTGSATIRAATGTLSANASVTIKTYTLAAPTGLTAAAGSASRVNLSWVDSVSGETAFTIEMSTDGTTFTQIGVVPTKITSFAATGLAAGSTYWFRLRSRNGNGNGLPSAAVSATTFAAPLAHWTLDEAAGTAVADATGNGHDARTRNDPLRTPGRLGNAMSFDGSDDYVELPNQLLRTDLGSVSLWLRTGRNFASVGHVFYFSDDTYGNGHGSQFELHVNFTTDERLQFFIEGGTTDVNIASAARYADNAWHHVAATWDINGNAVLYVDGAQANIQVHDAFSFANAERTFLGRPALPGWAYQGLIDDVQVFGSAMTAAQVQAIYADGAPPTIVTVASASPSPTYERQLTLAALGADDAAEANLTYTWSVLGTPPGAVGFANVNGTNAGKSTLATFAAAGTYALRVTVTDAGGRSVTSDVSVVIRQLAAPATLTASPGDARVSLTWTASADAMSYSVKRSTTAAGPYTVVATNLTDTAWQDVAVTNGTKYFYVVTAINGSATADSPEASGTPQAAPRLLSLLVNDGAAQRSMVRSLTLTFDTAVTLAASAVSLTRDGSSVAFVLSPSAGPSTAHVLTFSGPGIIGGSLADGIYSLSVSGAGVSTAGGASMAGTSSYAFHRLFGDSNGNGVVDNTDAARFRRVFGFTYDAAFDYDSNGTVANVDLAQFRRRQDVAIL